MAQQHDLRPNQSTSQIFDTDGKNLRVPLHPHCYQPESSKAFRPRSTWDRFLTFQCSAQHGQESWLAIDRMLVGHRNYIGRDTYTGEQGSKLFHFSKTKIEMKLSVVNLLDNEVDGTPRRELSPHLQVLQACAANLDPMFYWVDVILTLEYLLIHLSPSLINNLFIFYQWVCFGESLTLPQIIPFIFNLFGRISCVFTRVGYLPSFPLIYYSFHHRCLGAVNMWPCNMLGLN